MFGKNPFSGEKEPSLVPSCPICKSEEFDAKANQYEIFRICRKCGNRWSGGSVGAASLDHTYPATPAGMPSPDDHQSPNVVPKFRDPNSNYDPGDDW